MYARMTDGSVVIGLERADVDRLIDGDGLLCRAVDLGIEVMIVARETDSELLEFIEEASCLPLPPPSREH